MNLKNLLYHSVMIGNKTIFHQVSVQYLKLLNFSIHNNHIITKLSLPITFSFYPKFTILIFSVQIYPNYDLSFDKSNLLSIQKS